MQIKSACCNLKGRENMRIVIKGKTDEIRNEYLSLIKEVKRIRKQYQNELYQLQKIKKEYLAALRQVTKD